jgi:hypothetical protein
MRLPKGGLALTIFVTVTPVFNAQWSEAKRPADLEQNVRAGKGADGRCGVFEFPGCPENESAKDECHQG